MNVRFISTQPPSWNLTVWCTQMSNSFAVVYALVISDAGNPLLSTSRHVLVNSKFRNSDFSTSLYLLYIGMFILFNVCVVTGCVYSECRAAEVMALQKFDYSYYYRPNLTLFTPLFNHFSGLDVCTRYFYCSTVSVPLLPPPTTRLVCELNLGLLDACPSL